jgi:hypothetical protein
MIMPDCTKLTTLPSRGGDRQRDWVTEHARFAGLRKRAEPYRLR